MISSISKIFVVNNSGIDPEYLLLRSSDKYLRGTWEPPAGRVWTGETVVDRAVTTLFEETGVEAEKFYYADYVHTYFAHDLNHLYHVHIFVAFLEKSKTIKLCPCKHDKYDWFNLSRATKHMTFRGSKDALYHIAEEFVESTPNEIFRINLDNCEGVGQK